MRRNQLFIYSLTNKVVFPYNEYQVSLNSTVYDGMQRCDNVAKQHDNLIGFVTKADQTTSQVEKIDGVSRYGTLMKIQKQSMSDFMMNDKVRVTKMNVIGITFARFKVLSLVKRDIYYIANVEILNDDLPKDFETTPSKKKIFDKLKQELKSYFDCTQQQSEAMSRKQRLDLEKSINKVVYSTISQIDLPISDKLAFLQINDPEVRIITLTGYLTTKTENLKGISQLEEKVRKDLMPPVRPQAMGTSPAATAGKKVGEIDRIRQRMEEKDLPKHVREEMEKQIETIDASGSQNRQVSLRYLETLLDIPWNESTEDCKDLKKAEEILNSQHTGLEKVKQRILEFLAVRFRNGNTRGNILCLHGPPGVGKTSIAKSIAEALGRQFSRISLGGVTDEAQLRGHRRTYVAALPGMIIKTLIKSKSNNPVILLDEIEKLGRSYRGDPANALLEILDPSQNTSFVDHYVSLPIDLSKVMFICTANDVDELSLPLRNRLELISISGYTSEEKFDIATKNIIPEQKKQNGVADLISFKDDAVNEIIKYSTEMGVRQLERDVAKICRKVAYKGKKEEIDVKRVNDILGKRKEQRLWTGVGVVKGMAWTTHGGKVLIVQAVKSVGKGKIEITGQLGDVMKESVKIALSWIKANFNTLAMLSHQVISVQETIEELDKFDVHIHFPEGAIKKDGPSAGVTIVTCLASLMSGMRVKEKLSMTGEISLSGQVLPVGGIKQKCIAAITKGIEQIIIPKDNASDLDDIPEHYRKRAKFYPVSDLKQVLSLSLIPNSKEMLAPKL